MFILPMLNYASVAWDHHPIGDVDQLELVQRRGARYEKNSYHGHRSPEYVTNMIEDVKWLSLKEQRRAHRLDYQHKIKNREVDIDQGNIIQPGGSRTRGRGE